MIVRCKDVVAFILGVVVALLIGITFWVTYLDAGSVFEAAADFPSQQSAAAGLQGTPPGAEDIADEQNQAADAEPEPPEVVDFPQKKKAKEEPMKVQKDREAHEKRVTKVAREGGGQVPFSCSALGLQPAGENRNWSLPRLPYYNKSFAYRDSPFRNVRLLDDALWDAALTRAPGNLTLLSHMLLRLWANRSVLVQVRGGSMPYGVGCEGEGGKVNRACAWPSMLLQHLRQAFPGAPLVVDNQAKRGFTSDADLPEFVAGLTATSKAPDLLIFDFTQNDGSISEPTLRATRFLLPLTQVLMMWTGFRNGKPRARTDAQRSRDYIKTSIALRHYHIPMVSYWDAEDYYVDHGGDYDDMWNHTWNRHPRWVTHAYIGDMLVRWLNQALARLETCNLQGALLPDFFRIQPSVRPPSDLGAYEDPIEAIDMRNAALSQINACFVPLASHSAHSPGNSTPARTPQGSWTLLEDRPGKPGWIATGRDEAITFPVFFSDRPKLMVSFLKTYDETWGTVEVLLENKVLGKISPFWKDKVSLTVMEWFTSKDLPVQPDTPYKVSVRMISGTKFKLTAVMSC
eukprot:TRINITY_DN89771_c0_g1_i1.p1 TRINITY_DN89771_c0_g1~~TRINITY_DN89771_c0_g1_i1.p1  ORF type:complete len:572 (-),score=91.16 TRINITY_DN89771_c0_g1_i1:254-1969(-)